MKQRKNLWGLTSLILLTACQTTQIPTPPLSTPAPSPSATPTAEPTAIPTATPVPTPLPTVIPVATPTPVPDMTPTPVPTAIPTATPVPTPTPEITSMLRVLVFDDLGSRLNNAIVKVKSNDPTLVFESTATLENGYHVIKDIPTQKTMEVSVTAPGYTTRKRLASLSALETKLDMEFKGDQYAISNKPEVVMTKPAYSESFNANGVIELTFSENMNKESVQRSFALQSNSPDSDVKMSVGTPIAKPISVRGTPTDSVYDIRHFNFEWDTDRVIRLTPKYGLPIASDRRFRVILSYNDGSGNADTGGIKDVDGNKARQANISTSTVIKDVPGGTTTEIVDIEDGPFLVGTQYKAFLPFSVTDNLEATRVTGVGSEISPRDNFFLNFSKDLYFDLTTTKTVVGGANNQTGSAPAGNAFVTAAVAAKNYSLNCNGTPVTLPASAVAVFTGVNRVMVSVDAADNLFNTGDKCTVSFSGLLDIAGKFMSEPSISFVAP
ncbi:hypothetical protein COW36_13680 [bacterium (Candidatus Blackallbacteria) CG17_big_fil_post_rev_8_21_14_2_50_48_46]|uniref:SbsA Ig-like domain-containing protein n=1 Tax=bacterium (Candidatus Blackallbacteria) CG17_big_fil_post_rev_8_21_14_2_50_48_46 TaxID=2014261 RepID=A0A2M7G2Z8_9BACT|nr:MAG: hypothetical protein COW64_07295 [bacterium (Candidatus Blackallbacteria) CG18_big_fil_WC_8_21_14_2_50_49_26]PIW16179.1 MAG: hypothetical protein COW36_13680 [bacterium (Candidatus Blackallbacteria) CG17_big_fil_post_rev_8_21_14_2_50_48_46]PIW49939.1 MAG: hypothetical protein COW20_04625 [bacterium (Candidatus Blackallbacteria) CG13_big_fil_rev_8_21_14_2_50_49_14]